ncbi:hypothetical protein SHIRM173S_07593 [Streptomyces hirsutus]
MARKQWLLVGLAAVLTACSGLRTGLLRTGPWRSRGYGRAPGYGYVFDIARDGAEKTRLTSYEQTSVSCLRGTCWHRWAAMARQRPLVRRVRSSWSSAGKEAI